MASRPTTGSGCATRGVLRVKLKASGRAAHSSFPELGESAIDKLLDALVAAPIDRPSPTIEVLGRTHYTIGLIAGGVAPNVVSPSAEAEVMFRTVERCGRDSRRHRAARVAAWRSNTCSKCRPPGWRPCPGFDTAVFPYTTDIPFLSNWGQPLLFGPGSIHVAHTADEFVETGALDVAVAGYVRIARQLLAQI